MKIERDFDFKALVTSASNIANRMANKKSEIKCEKIPQRLFSYEGLKVFARDNEEIIINGLRVTQPPRRKTRKEVVLGEETKCTAAKEKWAAVVGELNKVLDNRTSTLEFSINEDEELTWEPYKEEKYEEIIQELKEETLIVESGEDAIKEDEDKEVPEIIEEKLLIKKGNINELNCWYTNGIFIFDTIASLLLHRTK